MIFCYSFK